MCRLCLMDACPTSLSACFFFNDTATTEIYTLSLHDALPIRRCTGCTCTGSLMRSSRRRTARSAPDRKSTRLNSSHVEISYAVFCLKKKKKMHADCPFEKTKKSTQN